MTNKKPSGNKSNKSSQNRRSVNEGLRKPSTPPSRKNNAQVTTGSTGPKSPKNKK